MATALITGASVGIGRELALLFARDRHHLILVARDKNRLEEVARECQDASGASVRVHPADLAKGDTPEALHRELIGADIQVDYLVNNAGFGTAGPFHEMDTCKILDMIQVNVTALTHFSRLFLPAMLQRNTGGILNVASTAAFQAGPYMAAYYATKAFVLSFSEALAEETKRSQVVITAVCPGPTHTEFQQRAGLQAAAMFRSKMLSVLDAATVARIGYDGFKRGKRIVVTGWMNRLHVSSVRLAPRRLVTRIASSVNRSKH